MIEALHSYLFGPAVLMALLSAGGYLFLRLRAFWIFHPVKSLKEALGGRGRWQTFSALCLALGGTMGVGNITGVALSLMLGGAGSVIWMLICAFFAMGIKYAEVVLAMDSRTVSPTGQVAGGAPYYMPGKMLPCLFSLLCLICACLQGGMLQGNAAASALAVATPLSPVFWGFALGLGTAVFLLFFPKRLGGVTACLIPIATLAYLVLCLGVIFTFRHALPSVLLRMLREAFSVRAGMGGVGGYLMLRGARVGCARGLLSNEAGCGTSPLAHMTATGTSPGGQGVWGIFEVFLDTVVVCSLTGVACLCVCPEAEEPMAYVVEVFSSVFGQGVAPWVGGVVAVFGIATILSWSHYGVSCFSYFLKNSQGGAVYRWLYLSIYCLFVFFGALMPTGVVFSLTDLLLAFMTLVNLWAVIKKADRVVALSAKAGFLTPQKHGCVPGAACQEPPDG